MNDGREAGAYDDGVDIVLGNIDRCRLHDGHSGVGYNGFNKSYDRVSAYVKATTRCSGVVLTQGGGDA